MYNVVSKNQATYMWAVLLLCKFITGQEEVKLGPCDEDRVFEVLNSTAGQNLTLDVRIPWYSIRWNLRTARGPNIYVGMCHTYFRGRCLSIDPGVFNLSLILHNATLGVSSILTVSALEKNYNISGSYFDNGTALFGNSSVYIDIPSPIYDSERPVYCRTDFVDLAQRVDCMMSYNTSSTPWSVKGRCDVTKVYSAMGRYKCQLMAQTIGEPMALGNSVLMTTHYVDNGPYVSGYCMISSVLPVSSGNYTYSVEITPGKKKYVVHFIGLPEISIPSSAILEHDCPTYVMEGIDVTCACRSAQNVLGSPQGYVRWVTSGSERLSVNRVQRNFSAVQNLQCHLVWNGQIIKSIDYTIDVRYKPSTVSLSHTCPPYLTEGSSLDCSCVASDAGNPPATLSWGGSLMTSPSDHLLRHNLQSDDDGTTMTCRMTWDGVLITSVNYTVLVVPDARAALARGVGIGLGVGMALIGFGAAVLVLVLWRRGWELVLPCAKKRETTRTDRKARVRFKRPFVFKKRTESDQLNTAAQASAYEAVDASMIGVASTYETLRVDPASAVSRKKKKGRKKRGGPSYDNTAITLDFHPGTSGAKAYKNVTSRDKSKGERKRTADSDASVYVIP